MEKGRLLCQGTVLFPHANRTTTVWEQFWGLIGRRKISSDTALCIHRCDQVHTVGVRVPIDCVGCDAQGRVLWSVSLSPRRISPRVSGCAYVWESGAGTLCGRISVGDILEWEPSN
jgi:uncharacterized membrane protein (UPF0127 family)